MNTVIILAALTAVNFADHPVAWIPGRNGATNAAEAAKQVWTDKDGLHVFYDKALAGARKWNWGSFWTSSRLGEFQDGDIVRLRAKYFPGTLLDADANISLTDSRGLGAIQAPRLKMELIDGERVFTFRIDAKRGRKEGETCVPPFGLTSISFGFMRERGEAVFTRIEKVEDVGSRRTFVADVPVDTDTTHPGAMPFAGPAEIVVTCTNRANGAAELRLKKTEGPYYGKDMPPFRAELRDGRAVFRTDLDREQLYAFWRVSVDGAAIRPATVIARTAASAAETLAISVETGNALHVVRTNLAERAVVVFRNLTAADRKWKGRLVIRDDSTNAPAVRAMELAIAGRGAKRIALPEAMPRNGLWRVQFEAEGEDGSKALLETRFAQIDHHVVGKKIPSGRFRFGPNYHMLSFMPSEHDLNLTLEALTAMGATMVRANIGVGFRDVCPESADRFNWECSDRMLGLLEARGVGVDSIVFSTPAWARIPGREVPKVDTRYCPSRPGLFRDYCRALSARYGTRIDYYEIGNELDLRGPETLTIDEAVRMQKEGGEGVKAGCPEATVITCGWTVPSSDFGMVRQNGMQERVLTEARGFYDVHPIHMHAPWHVYRDFLDRFFANRRQLGVNVPWFANETALTSAYDETAVADCLWQKIVYSWAKGSTDYIWYNLIANGCNPTDGEGGYGLMTGDFHPRCGYAAFAALAALLNGFDFDREIAAKDTPPLYVFRGERGGIRQQVVVTWNDLTDRTVSVDFESDARSVETVDLYGNRRVLGNHRWEASVRPSALLLEGASFVRAAVVGFEAEPEAKGLVCGTGPIESRPPDLVIDSKTQVFDIFQAVPDQIHRNWKGPSDLSAKAWFSNDGSNLTVTVEVADDVHADGDRVKLHLVRDGKKEELQVPRLERDGLQKAIGLHRLTVPDWDDRVLVNLVLEEDDGEGPDGTMTFSRYPVRLIYKHY